MDYRELYMASIHQYFEEQGLPEDSTYLGKCNDNISSAFCKGTGWYDQKAGQICFRCAGDGEQTIEDVIRNRFYDHYNRFKKDDKIFKAMKAVREMWTDRGIDKAYEFQCLLERTLNIEIGLLSEEDLIKKS